MGLVDGESVLASKICGAGGGGCVFLWCADGQKEATEKLCEEKGYQVLKV